MAEALAVYPPGPTNVPPDLTAVAPGYRLRVVVVLTSLFLFVLLYLGLLVGSAYLCYYAFAPEGASRSTVQGLFRDVGNVQQKVAKVYNEAVEKSKRGAIDDARFLQVVEHDVLPAWQAEHRRLAAMKGLPAEEQRFVEQFRRYAQLEEEAWGLLSRAIRQEDDRLGGQAKQKLAEADRLAQQLIAEGPRAARSEKGSSSWWFLVGIASGVLCLFLVKGFFKRRHVETGLRVEVTPQQQPVLFAFLRRLCQETRAPPPHRVYLTPEVNAAVFYHESFLNLFLPAPKNLLIGLGLVNRLNLSEFKAVLAHEFGHFSQHSMKLGTYVYTSNRVIGDLVFGRDWLDDVLAGLRGTDIRIAVFAWAFSGFLWGLRKSLEGLFRVINFANSALARQMEYNADLVAVSVTGSDALVHALARLDFAGETLGQAWNDLTAAADRGLYSRDLFYHQTRAADYLRALRQDKAVGEPPALPDDPRQVVQVFRPEDTSVPKMWATHPNNHDRETNAKRHYLRSCIDERSAWVLFQDAPTVREAVTRQVYAQARNLAQVELREPEVVQAFIDEEHAETTYHPRYHGLYDHRYLTPGDPDELVGAGRAQLADAAQLVEAQARFYGDDFQARMKAHQGRSEEYGMLLRLAHGAVELTGKDFAFRDARYRAADAKRLLEQVKRELDQDFVWMGNLDREVFLVHAAMARQLGDAVQRDLEERYRCHLRIQGIHGRLTAERDAVQDLLAQLSGKRQLSEAEFHGALSVLGTAHDTLGGQLDIAGRLRLPALKNVTPGEPLGPLLLSQRLIPRLNESQNSLDGEWIGKFLAQLGEVIDKAARLHFKSLGAVLALQEGIAERWTAQQTSPAASPADPAPESLGTVPSGAESERT
jgi:Zn-dependent protease with chaperone function